MCVWLNVMSLLSLEYESKRDIVLLTLGHHKDRIACVAQIMNIISNDNVIRMWRQHLYEGILVLKKSMNILVCMRTRSSLPLSF